MTIQLKLAAAFFDMRPDDIMLSDSQVALLADVQDVITIAPRSHARISTPIAFTGDGNTIALIDMHCGKLSHALGKEDDALVARGEYFLPAINEEVAVSVDVINETAATIMIRPGTRIGILTFVNINSDAEDPALLQSTDPEVSAQFQPEYLDAADLPAYAHAASNGIDLKADIGGTIEIEAGATKAIPTGLVITLPAGLEKQVRASNAFAKSLVMHSLPAVAAGQRQPITLKITNIGSHPIAIQSGDDLAQLAFVPVIRAPLNFSASNKSALPVTANAAQ